MVLWSAFRRGQVPALPTIHQQDRKPEQYTKAASSACAIGKEFLPKWWTKMNPRYQPHLRLALTCVAVIVPRVALAFQPQPLRKLVAPPQSALVEKGGFRLYKFEQLIGEEFYHIASDGDGVTVAMNSNSRIVARKFHFPQLFIPLRI